MKAFFAMAMVLSLTGLAAFAGPGVSSGDEGLRPDFVCRQPNLQDSSWVASFTLSQLARPQVEVLKPVGETSVEILNGLCEQKQGADELSLECKVVDGPLTYRVTLESMGSPKLISTIRFLNGGTEVVLDCEDVAERSQSEAQ